MNKKGFTLIELLAVIVILAVIALIATPVILNVIEKAREGAAKDSALAYMDAVYLYQGTANLKQKELLKSNIKYNVTKPTIIEGVATEAINNIIEIKNSKPTGNDDYIILNDKYTVEEGILTIGRYKIIIKNGKVDKVDKLDKIKVKDISINLSDMSMERGSEVSIITTFEPSNATEQDLIYKSSDNEVLTIDKNGRIKALKNGTSKVSVISKDDEKIKKEITVTVISPSAIIGLTLKTQNDVEKSVKVGETLQLIGVLEPSDATSNALTWTSSNESVLKVSDSGVVTGISVGTATVKAKTQSNIEATIDIEVKAIPVENITISGETSVKKGKTITLTATVTPSNATNKTVTWTSSNTSVATVTNGVVTGVSGGTTIITVTSSNGKTATKEITVGPVSFADDSWATIAAAVKSGNYPYQVGDTKTITLAEHTNDCSSFTKGASYVCNSSVEPEKQVTLRVANVSSPTDFCNNSDNSQTACGFVVEFADIIEFHNMNPANATNTYGTNVGGWKDSVLRTYVNETIYNALPEDLQSVIVDTTVVSGHGSTSGETNFTTTDKLYLLNAQELWETDSADTSVGTSRQLDYYANLGVTRRNFAGAIKQYNGSNSNWWLRSATSDETVFLTVGRNVGMIEYYAAYYPTGISPSFRIA